MTLGPRGPQEAAFAPIIEAIHRGLLQHERLLKFDTPLGANTLIRLKGGDIQIHAPGRIDIKGSMHSFSGPASMPYPMPTQPDAVCVPCLMKRTAGRSAFVSTGG